MKTNLFFATSFTGLIIAASVCLAFIKTKQEVELTTTTNGFAVVELFTSEGCSSCPPADEVLETISKEYEENVYLLGFHVDYWNRLGWKDEFSNTSYTNRQQQYATVFQKDGVYTPQAIVNGKAQLVGSDETGLKSEIQKQLSSVVNEAPVINAVKLNNDTIEISCTVKENSNTVLNIALVQLHAVTNVSRGENEGKKLSHINIVRDFKTVNVVSSTNKISLTMPAGLNAEGCKLIAYTQNRNTLKITGASEAVIPL